MQRGSDCRVWMTSTAKGAAGERAEPRHTPRADPAPGASPSSDIVGQGPSEALLTLPIRLNGIERVIPLRLARANAAAALCRGAQLACDKGGFQAEVRDVPVLVARVSLPNAAPSACVRRRVAALAGDLLQVGMDAVPQAWVPIGCIPGLYVCGAPGGGVEAHVHSERVDAPGGDALRRVAESLARPLTRLAECEVAPPITLCELQHQRVEARCRIAASALFEGRPAASERGSEQTAPRTDLRRELELDRHDAPLAVAHNAHVIDAMLAASVALGIDNGRWEGGARRYAGRWGSCEPLVRWSSVRGDLIGELRLPVVLGHARAGAAPQAGASRAPLELLRLTDAMLQLACVALAASLAFSSSRWRARAARPPLASTLPPPLPAADFDRELSLGARSSESGVHAVVRGRSAIAS